MVKRLFRPKNWNSNVNLIPYLSIMLAFVGIIWLSLNEVNSGRIFTTIFLGGTTMLVLTFFFLGESQKNTIKNLIKHPFSTDTQVGASFYLLGLAVPLIVNGIIGLFNITFSVTQFMIPLSAGKVLNGISQTFAVAETTADPFFQWFISTFVAGSIEEFTFGFIVVLVGTTIGMLLWKLLFKNANPNSQGARNFYLTFGIILSTLLFVGAHNLNGTYVGIMFLIAGGFRLIMNYSIYVLGNFMSFTIGYHIMNNAIWYWGALGPQKTIDALLTPGGTIILTFLGLLIFFVFRDIDPVRAKLKKIFQNVIR